MNKEGIMFGIGTGELIIIFLILLLLFGAKKLPEIAKSMGNAVNEFKRAKNDIINSPETASPKKEAKSVPAEASGNGQQSPVQKA